MKNSVYKNIAIKKAKKQGGDLLLRDDKIKKLRFIEGWTLDKIGIFFGLSRQRIDQIIGEEGRGIQGKRSHIKKAVNILGLDDTKTTKELKKITGKTSINWYGKRHKISRGNAGLGYRAEEFVSKILTENGIEHTLTNSRPVDIILNNGLKVEVKSRSKPQPTKTSRNFYYFPLIKDVIKGEADYYVLVIGNDCFVIPSTEIPIHGGVGFVWPKSTSKVGRFSKWAEYHNRFDLLKGAK